MEFTEELLHYVWKSRFLYTQKLRTDSGEDIKIIQPGVYNSNSGPDFENALLSIGQTRWAGNVEMHLNSSDWFKHGHDKDQAYENVILHVVYIHDRPVHRKDGSGIPVLELRNLIPDQLTENYRNLIASKASIPCSRALPDINPLFIYSWLSRALAERLEIKSEEVIQSLQRHKGNWNDTFYIHLARNFGFKCNELPFECLARSLPQHLLARHKNRALQTEALIFGQSGFLEQDFDDDYPEMLKKEYQFLRKKYDLKPLDASMWKFMRMRPANFPSLRLAQFAALVLKSDHLFSKILKIDDLEQLRDLFADLPVNPYWGSHFHFHKTAKLHSTQLGDLASNSLLINSVSVFLFAYGKYHDQDVYRLRALRLLEQIPSEKNKIINQFTGLGVKVLDAGQSQSLLHTKKIYCEHKKCLSCGIGAKVLTHSSHDSTFTDLF